MDFSLTEDLDLRTDDFDYVQENTNETALMMALFTDKRVGTKAGHWSDVLSSTLWTRDQSRVTEEDAREAEEQIKEVLSDCVSDGMYARATADVGIISGVLRVTITCFDSEEREVLNKVFIV